MQDRAPKKGDLVSGYRALIHNDARSSSLVSDLVRAVHRLLLIAADPSRHRRVATCFRSTALAAYTTRQPQLPYKYLRRNYLASTLDRTQRARVLVFHFDYLLARFERSAMEAIAHRGIALWSSDGVHRHDIRMVMADPVDNEGELALEYHVDDRTISVLSFSFAPASLFDSPGRAVTLISRVQIVDADATFLRTVAKDLSGIAPRFALVAVMQGLVLALGQSAILAVSLANQTVARSSPELLSPASYDLLFAAIGGQLGQDGFYRLSVPFTEAEPAQATASHRRRARARRARRQAITDEARSRAGLLLTTFRDPKPEYVAHEVGEPNASACP